jgi:hypothetical protein
MTVRLPTQLLINFEWWRDAAGYRLVPDTTPPDPEEALVYHPLGIRVISSEVEPLRLVRRGGDLIPYHPIERFETLFRIFANDVRMPNDVLAFAQKYGSLTVDGLDMNVGEPAYHTVVHAEGMREFLSFASGSKQLLTRGIEAQLNPLGEIDIAIVLDAETTTPKLRLSPASLLDALWLQFAQSLAGGNSLRQCEYCGRWFQTGDGTGRRRDAKFCSNEHRITFNSLKRSTGKAKHG